MKTFLDCIPCRIVRQTLDSVRLSSRNSYFDWGRSDDRVSVFSNGTRLLDEGDSLCQVAMEQDRKEKAPVPAEVWALAVRGKEEVAVKDAAGDKAVDAARGKVKVVVGAKRRGRAANRIRNDLGTVPFRHRNGHHDRPRSELR